MISLKTLLEEARRLGVKLVADGASLKVRGPEKALTPALLDALRRHKRELLGILQGGDASAPDADRTEVRYRVDAFQKHLTDWRMSHCVGFPLLGLPNIGPEAIDGCVSCGTHIPQERLRCDPCYEAARIVVEEARARECIPRAGPTVELVVPFSADERFTWWEAGTPEETAQRFRVARIAAGLPPKDLPDS